MCLGRERRWRVKKVEKEGEAKHEDEKGRMQEERPQKLQQAFRILSTELQ